MRGAAQATILVRNRLRPPVSIHRSSEWSEWLLLGPGVNRSLGKIKCQELHDAAYCLSHSHLPALHIQRSLSLHSPLAQLLPCSFAEGSALSLPQCHTAHITHQRGAFQQPCSFASARFPSGLYMSSHSKVQEL